MIHYAAYRSIGICARDLLYGLAFSLSIFAIFVSASFAEMIHSRAVVVMEPSTGRILYAKDPNRRLPPASTAKLMTAIVAIERVDLSHTVMIGENASRVHPLKLGLKKGDKVSVEELLYAALMKSANDAAVALSEAVAGSEMQFVDLMNQKAISIAGRNTKFINSTGLPGPHQFTTALDLSIIMRYALGIPKLKEIMGTTVAVFSTENGETLFLRNTAELLWYDESFIGGKTGYTWSAGHCFVGAAEREKKTIIVTLLGNPSRNSLWRETQDLIAKGYQMMAEKNDL